MAEWTQKPLTPKENLTLLLTTGEVFLSLVQLQNKEFSQAYEKRPVYNIGHMVNTIEKMDYFMSVGANAIQIDVEYLENGTATDAHYGTEYCNCLWEHCESRTKLTDLFEYIRETTIHENNRYASNLSLVVLHLKLEPVGYQEKYQAGVDIAEKIVKHLWHGASRSLARNVLVSVKLADDLDVIQGVNHTISREMPTMYKRIGYDVRDERNLRKIKNMYNELGVRGNYWQGAGLATCLRKDFPSNVLQAILEDRESVDSPYRKVYHWTVDVPAQMRRSLQRGVDAIITSKPGTLRFVMGEYFPNSLRLATPEDNPWMRFDGWAPFPKIPATQEVRLGDDFLEVVPGVND